MFFFRVELSVFSARVFSKLHFVSNKTRANLKTGVSRKQSTPDFPKNEHILPPDTPMCAYQGLRYVRFSENLACFVFLKLPFWDSPFCLINDDIKTFPSSVFAYNEITTHDRPEPPIMRHRLCAYVFLDCDSKDFSLPIVGIYTYTRSLEYCQSRVFICFSVNSGIYFS